MIRPSFYAIYESNILVNNDMTVNIFLKDINKHKGVSEEGYEYMIQVDLPEEAKVKVIREEFMATKKERVEWFLTHAVLLTVLCSLLVFIGVSVGISILETAERCLV